MSLRPARSGLKLTPAPVVRGRDSLLASLGTQLDRVRSGVCSVVLLEGATGMGKSRLIAEAARVAGRMGFGVGVGAPEPGESIVELAPLLGALFEGPEPLLDRGALHMSRSLPEQRYWLLQDIQEMLERAALKRPLLVCLDDMQWADTGTTAALRVLPARLSSLPIAWLVAFRPDTSTGRLLSALEKLERDGAERLMLGPLDDAAVAQLTVDVMRAEPDDALLELARRVRGNPFQLMELLIGLRDENLVRRLSESS